MVIPKYQNKFYDNNDIIFMNARMFFFECDGKKHLRKNVNVAQLLFRKPNSFRILKE